MLRVSLGIYKDFNFDGQNFRQLWQQFFVQIWLSFRAVIHKTILPFHVTYWSQLRESAFINK